MRKKSLAKTIHTLTIGEFSLYHRTANRKYLKRFSWLPDWGVDELIKEIDAELGGGTNQKLQKEKHKLNSQYKIQRLIILLRALENLMIYLEDVKMWYDVLGVKVDTTKIKERLEEKKKEVFLVSEIKIEKIEDLVNIKKEIERRIDKFNEHFKQEQVTDGLTFGQIKLGVFSVMNMSINDNMPMGEFFELKEMAKNHGRTE